MIKIFLEKVPKLNKKIITKKKYYDSIKML